MMINSFLKNIKS